MTDRFELINPKIEGADTVKLIKTNNVECFGLDEEITLCEAIGLLDEYDRLLSSIADDRDFVISELKAVQKLFPKNRLGYYPKCCGDCNYFSVYRNFCGEPSTTSVTMGCKVLDNEEDYDRDTGDKVAKSIFDDCPFKEVFDKIKEVTY